MKNNIRNEDLRRRAEEILAKRNQNQPLPDKSVYQLLEKLNLYQIELEHQNENLIKTQQDLQLSNKKYTDLYDLAPIAYFTLNEEGLIVDVNQSGLNLLGMKKNSVVNRCFSLFITPEFQLLFAKVRQQILRDKSPNTCEIKLQKWSGPAFDAVLECKLIRDVYDQHDQCLICITDISNRKLAEQTMQMQRIKISAIDRMRSMNEQIYTLTRNQNHSLTVMTNFISGCIRRLEIEKFNSRELLSTLHKIAAQATVLSDIILQVRNLTSKSVLRYEFTDINSIIIDTLSLVSYESSQFPIDIQYEKMEHLPFVKVDKLHIQQVILSLARNAIEAMSDAKTSQPKLLIELRLNNPNEIGITMMDNGPGFESNKIQHIFEPNFTTKSYALGLGLTTSRSIIEKHGGELTAQLNPAGGASFNFTLPCAASIAE